jgi:hypothetical protein
MKYLVGFIVIFILAIMQNVLIFPLLIPLFLVLFIYYFKVDQLVWFYAFWGGMWDSLLRGDNLGLTSLIYLLISLFFWKKWKKTQSYGL